MQLSRRALAMTPSPTKATDNRAKQLAASGRDIVNLTVGEPDFDTPPNAKAGAVAAIAAGKNKYTATAGTLELRTAAAGWLAREHGIEYAPEAIVVSTGAKQSLFNAVMTLVNPGDEVIMQSPCWGTYPEMVKLADAVPVIVPTDASDAFKMSAGSVSAWITPRTKAILLNNPLNPAGSVYSAAELRAIADLAVAHDLWIITDELYDRLVYDGTECVSVASLGDDIKSRSVVVNGVSKTYAMTGWRIGFAAAPLPVVKAMTDLQGHVTSNPSSISQAAALAALLQDHEAAAQMRAEFARRRAYVIERLARIDALDLELVPMGAFYAYPNTSALVGRTIGEITVSDSDSLCTALLETAGVALVPGQAFGSPHHVRISYAASMDRLSEGFDRLERVLA
jgi:aspartate aminotransferase